ncbi:hypothetical protein SEA_SATIS_35 [Streptomyces phage Satis]|nr:hypothetical protein SEA_SATIS_35 [Streptomyces phage Satis]QBZ71934.1 hypothetical protein SEA_KRADAL_35 [Streptomyces phage Kradal]QPL14352.1 hypothetical protein SEA_EHYELIMAYOE_35 [Streptomyces phage EhyElimayoE]
MSRQGDLLICDHCGEEIPQREYQHTWIGPVVAKGEKPRHYHLAREYPACRRVGGADPMPDVEPVGAFTPNLETQIALELAERFTAPGANGKPVHLRLEHGMLDDITGPDGHPALAPVTPRQAAYVISKFLREAGFVP